VQECTFSIGIAALALTPGREGISRPENKKAAASLLLTPRPVIILSGLPSLISRKHKIKLKD
jgi:hypothetical protein